MLEIARIAWKNHAFHPFKALKLDSKYRQNAKQIDRQKRAIYRQKSTTFQVKYNKIQ